MPQLHVLTGDGQERKVDLGETPVSFGRADDNQVVLAEQKASRRHCTFRPVRGNWRVVDEQSSNGTWLGGKPVLSARLQPGDEIEIGDTVITFVAQPSEMPRPDVARPPRRPRTIRKPWEALVAAFALAAIAWFGTRALADDLEAKESAAWNRVAKASIETALTLHDEAAYKSALNRVADDLRTHDAAADAVTIVNGALARGLQTVPAETRRPEWVRQLEQIEAGRSRMTAAERRAGLQRVLTRFAGDGQAVEAIAAVLRADEAAVRDRGAAEAARLLADADQAVADARFGRAFDDWIAWLAAAPEISREDERAVAAKMADARGKARAEAEAARVQFEDMMKESRLAAATAGVDAVMERLRGTGWDVWLAARTRRFGGSAADGAPGRPVSGGPRESDADRSKRIARDKVDRARKSADALAAKRRFADAAAVLSEAAGDATDAAVQADLHTLADDFAAEAGIVAKLLAEIRDDASRFGSVPLASGPARVTGATETEVLLGDAKGANPRPLGIDVLPSGAIAALLGSTKFEPSSYVATALLLREVGETDAYTAWMRKALSDPVLRLEASAVHARVLGVSPMPVDGYHPHPDDGRAILSGDELKRLRNATQIAALTKELVKVVDKIAVTKQAKQVETVAVAYAKVEAARKFALELIFDEAKYFYPYRARWKEYQPVQNEVDRRVAALREAWEDKASAKVRNDSALDKLVKQADDLGVEIAFLGGEAEALLDRVEKVRMYVGRDLTVQTFFESKADLELLEYNRQMLQANTRVKGAISDPERDQVRITNEYRMMFGHRRALRLHEKAVAAARGHSDDMSKIGFFDHTSPVPGKTTFADRMLLAGYPNTPCSENIAAGGSDAAGAHNSWCHSSGHHRNLLMPNWSELGSGQSGRYWTQNFGYATGDDQVGGPGP